MRKSLKIELAEARLLALRYHDITASIATMLDGKEWTPETLNDIADILRNAGFTIGEPCETECPCSGHALYRIAMADATGTTTKGEK